MSRNTWSGQRLPHPPGRRRFVGDIEREADPNTPVQNLMRRVHGLPELVEFKAFREKFVFALSARVCAQVADDVHFDKALAPAVLALRRFSGDALFTAFTHEPAWGVAHDLLVPAFTKPAMRGYHDTMNAVADDLVARWAASTTPVDVADDLTRMTLETIGRTAFGHSFGTFAHQERDPYVAAMVTLLSDSGQAAGLSTLPLGQLITRRPSRRARAAYATQVEITEDIIEARLAGGGQHGGGQQRGGEDLLGRMLFPAHAESGARLDRRNVINQVLTFLTAGHETTSGAVSFALWYLANDDRVRAAAQAETDDLLGPDPQSTPTFEMVPKFRYVRRVLDEALRLWPTAPAIGRSPRAVTTVAGWTMTPQDWLLVFIPAVHRDPAVWGPDPDRFDPDNFLPERVRARPAYSYLPFGVGTRACIGRQFALHEAVLVLARLLHRFDFAADPAYDLRVTERLTLMPKGFRLTVRERSLVA